MFNVILLLIISYVRSLVGMFLPLFCIVDVKTSNGLMPAARELISLNRLLIVPGVEHAMQLIGVNPCACSC